MDQSYGIRRTEPAGSCAFAEHCGSVAERNRLIASDYTADFEPFGTRPFRSHLVGLDTGGVRITAVRDEGGVRMRAAWHEDAFGAVFIWGTGTTVGRAAHHVPAITLAVPGTEVSTEHDGACRNLRIGIRGEALAGLRADPIASRRLEPWLRAGVFRPRADPGKEWRLQMRILRATRFAETAVARGVAVERVLAVIADEVVSDLLEVLADAAGADLAEPTTTDSRRRLVEDALVLLTGDGDEPASIAAVCRRLGVSERTLQRAFNERLGIGPRAWERERRLRAVHGAILVEGDRRTLTDIAMSCGFWHLGRFAAAYAELFGCSPSETRRRVRGGGEDEILAQSG